jgi:hypothetical protein
MTRGVENGRSCAGVGPTQNAVPLGHGAADAGAPFDAPSQPANLSALINEET